MPIYHMEVGDDYVKEFEARDDCRAMVELRTTAIKHSSTQHCYLYPGPIKSGVEAIGGAKGRVWWKF